MNIDHEAAGAQFALTVKLAVVLGAAGVMFWQLFLSSESMAQGWLGTIGPDGGIVAGVALLVVALLLIRAIISQHFRKPVKQLAAYIAEQNAGTGQQLPSSLLNRPDEVGALAGGIGRLVDKLTEQNQQLLEQTLYDPLTGLGNRRLLQRRLEVVLPLNRRMMTPLSALMIDVDFFKDYNDHYGHLAGDSCLIEIANVLCDTFRRDTDILVRHGGEEFLVILAGIDQEASYELAEAMRNMLRFVSIPHAKSTISEVVTVSIGVATVEPGMHIDVGQLIGCADSALYQCKRLGRNRSFCQAVADYDASAMSATVASNSL